MLKVGAFGTHLLSNGSGRFFWRGTVPADLKGKWYETEDAGIDDFIAWLKALPTEDQREHVGNLRNDIFLKFMNTLSNS